MVYTQHTKGSKKIIPEKAHYSGREMNPPQPIDWGGATPRFRRGNRMKGGTGEGGSSLGGGGLDGLNAEVGVTGPP